MPRSSAFTLARLPEGGLLVAYQLSAAPNDQRIVRLNSTGELDTTFGTEGEVVFDALTVFELVVEPDGRGFTVVSIARTGLSFRRFWL